MQKSDTLFKLAPLLALVFVYLLDVTYFELQYLLVGRNRWFQHVPIMHSLLLFVILMLLVLERTLPTIAGGKEESFGESLLKGAETYL